MANNTSPQAIRVGNTKIRPAADKILQIYFFMKTMQNEYGVQNWAALFPVGDPTGPLIDGAATDGRTIIDNGDVNDVIASLGAFIAFMEANTNEHLNKFLKVAVNPGT